MSNAKGYPALRHLRFVAVPLFVAIGIIPAGDARAENAEAEKGKALFDSECSRCHQVGEDAKNKVGPHLDLIIGRKAGSVESFRYSSALKQAGEGGLVWDEAALDAYLEKPRDFIKGNRMSYRAWRMPENGWCF